MPKASAQKSTDNCEWSEISEHSAREWNKRLESSTCSYRQFPFWATAYQHLGYRPRFFTVGEPKSPIAFAAIVEVRHFPFKFALVDRGPYIFSEEISVIKRCLKSFVELAKNLGYVFVRFTPGQEKIFKCIADMPASQSTEPYPFCRDSRNGLIVSQHESDEAMFAALSAKARKEIRRAKNAHYEIRVSNSSQDFEKAWGLFERLASKKNFGLSSKPPVVWHEILRQGAENGFAKLYSCSIGDDLVSARIVVRDGTTCEGMLSALDTTLLNGRPSPASLMVWEAMRDGQRSGCKYYNMGGPGDPNRNNHVFEFKKKFNPLLESALPPLCLVIRSRSYYLWIQRLRIWRSWKARGGLIRFKVSR